MTIVTRCPGCLKRHSLEVDEHGFKDWRDGELIQRALPGLTDTQREMIQTGICGFCWEKANRSEEDRYSRF